MSAPPEHSAAHFTDRTRRDGDGGFKVGDIVQVNDGFRPVRYAGKSGTVVEVRGVVPKKIAEKLHAEGKTTNNGDIEIAVHLGRLPNSVNHYKKVWFLPRELHLAEGVKRPLRSPESDENSDRGQL
jgi:uncharacterized protein YcnI